MNKATIKADSALDWFDVLWAIYIAANQMEDCEDYVQKVEMPDGSFLKVDLNAGGTDNPNVYVVTDDI